MKVFKVNGREYGAPEQLGKNFEFLKSEGVHREFQKQNPHVILDSDEYEPLFHAWLPTVENSTYDLICYRAFLMPLGDAPPVNRVWFLEASPEDLKPIDDFFEDCVKRMTANSPRTNENGQSSINE